MKEINVEAIGNYCARTIEWYARKICPPVQTEDGQISTVFDYGHSILHYERKTTSTKYYARSILHYERSTSQFQNYPFKHLTQFPLSTKA